MNICDKCTHRIVCDHESAYRKQCMFFEETRPHGKWVWKSPTPKTIMTPHCNICGHMNDFLMETNFCPNCGADMQKEGDKNG